MSFFMTAGQVSDYTGAAALLDGLPKAQWLLGDRGNDADWFRDALEEKGVMPCIPGRKSRTKPVKYDKRRYKRRNRIEIMCGRLKDWRRVATRYDRCPTVFLSAVALAATVLFWLWVLTLGCSRLLRPQLTRSGHSWCRPLTGVGEGGDDCLAGAAPGEVADAELAAELIAFCREHLAHIKCPRWIDFTEQMPRLPTGKLYKRQLRDPYWSGRSSKIG
jgi:transposase